MESSNPGTLEKKKAPMFVSKPVGGTKLMETALRYVSAVASGVIVPLKMRHYRVPLPQVTSALPPGGVDWEVGDKLINTPAEPTCARRSARPRILVFMWIVAF